MISIRQATQPDLSVLVDFQQRLAELFLSGGGKFRV